MSFSVPGLGDFFFDRGDARIYFVKSLQFLRFPLLYFIHFARVVLIVLPNRESWSWLQLQLYPGNFSSSPHSRNKAALIYSDFKGLYLSLELRACCGSASPRSHAKIHFDIGDIFAVLMINFFVSCRQSLSFSLSLFSVRLQLWLPTPTP